MNGFVVVHKQVGVRCTDLVNRASRLTGSKVGHAGTLDSTASGVVLLLFGAATRLTETVMDWPKTYQASVRLGFETESDDYAGAPRGPRQEPGAVTLRAAELALIGQLGVVAQEPPQISALRVDGERAHRLARSGRMVQFAPRFVHNVAVRNLTLEGDRVNFQLTCHRGGYVRSVARLLGRQLGVGGHIASLERLNLGPLTLEGALSSEEITAQSLGLNLRPLEDLARYLPYIEADKFVGHRLLAGLPQWLSVLPNWHFETARSTCPLAVLTPQVISLCDLTVLEGRPCLKARVNLRRDRQ